VAKSPDAFRTISEVADWLGVEAHVLRFWESRFAQVKPVKRAGGRRYYRPSDMALLGGIRRLLHDDGMTIRGVQKILREQGVGHVAGLSPELNLDGVEVSVAGSAPHAPRPAPRAPATAQQPVGAAKPEAPTRASTGDQAPTLPFDLPQAPRSLPPDAATGPEREARSPAPADGAADVPLSEALRALGARLDAAELSPILNRARDLLERLQGAPGR
jgi:DNA-binding transcriptional MerR regulator